MNNAATETAAAKLRNLINHDASIPVLRKIWNRLIKAQGLEVQTAKLAARCEIDPRAPLYHNAVELTIREFDHAREVLTVSRWTGAWEVVPSHFGEYRREKVWTHDESAFEAACAAILAELQA